MANKIRHIRSATAGIDSRFRPPPPNLTASAARIWISSTRECQQKCQQKTIRAASAISVVSRPLLANRVEINRCNLIAAKNSMRQRFRLYRRKKGGRYYIHDDVTGKQESLGTNDRATAVRLFHSKSEATKQPAVNLQIARAYIAASDPQIATRNWRSEEHTSELQSQSNLVCR